MPTHLSKSMIALLMYTLTQDDFCRAWIGAGAYQRYIYCMHVFRACLQNPGNPAAAWNAIVLADKDNVQEMRQFYSRKKVDLQDIKNSKNSCLHRVLSCVSGSWDAIEKTAQLLCLRALVPLELAILATQADDIEGLLSALQHLEQH